MARHEELDERLIEKARNSYMEYLPVAVIARELGLNRASVQYYVNKQWKAERELMKADLFTQLQEAKKADFSSMILSSTKIIKRCLESMANREEAPTTREAKNVAEVLEKIDKILRLDQGNPTEITEEKPADPAEIRKRLNMDPFQEEAIEADYKEIP